MIWNQYPLSLLTIEFINGGTPSTKISAYWDGDIPWITGADVEDRYVSSARKHINSDAVANSSTHIVPKNAVLLVTRTGVGKVAKAGCDIAISQDLTGIVLKKSIDPDYAIYAIQSKIKSLARLQQGAIIKGLLRKDVEQLIVPLPAFSEQLRIVEILDQANSLREKRIEADKIAEKILPALFYKMFESTSIENKITIQELLDKEYLIVHKDGNFGSMYPRESDFGNEGVLFVTAKNVDELGFVDFQDSPRLNQEKADTLPFGWIDNGDVVLAHNATVGRVGIIENATERMLIGTSLTCFRSDPHKLDPYYLLGALRSNQFQNQLFSVMKQGTRNQVPITAQRRFNIVIPRIEDQIKFASQIRTLRSVFRNKQSIRVKIDHLFSTILYRAFSGDLTTKWREAHMKELMQEMEQQARELN